MNVDNLAVQAPDGNFRFVGIRYDFPNSEAAAEERLRTLHLPLGYSRTDDPGEKRKLVIEIYRALSRFAEEAKEADLRDKKAVDREGRQTAPSGRGTRADGPRSELSLKSFSLLAELFRLLRTPSILTIREVLGPRPGHFDHRQIHRALHKAMYLPDGTPILDDMDIRRQILRDQTADIVGMATWVARDAAFNLYGESLDNIAGRSLASEWNALADEFRHQYLGADLSLFGGKGVDVLRKLRHVLHEIDKRTPFKSPGYRSLFELLEQLFHCSVGGSDGDIWAMKGFANAWESICLEHAIELYKSSVLTCDFRYLPPEAGDGEKRKAWEEFREAVFSKNGKARRPDLVRKVNGEITIVDFKYYSAAELEFQEIRPHITKEVKDQLENVASGEVISDELFAALKKLKLVQDFDNLEAYRHLLAIREKIDPDEIRIELWVPDSRAKDLEELKLAAPSDKENLFKNVHIKYLEARKLVKEYGDKWRHW